MPTVIFKQPGGETQSVTAAPDSTLMVAALHNGIDGIEAECGGGLACGTCHVYVDEAWLDHLPPAAEDELAMLEEVTAPRRSNSRLACQIHLSDKLDGLTVRIPE